MACHTVALDKRPGVRPVGIGNTLFWDLEKIVMREAGEQAKTTCGNLQLCAGIEAGIEDATHTVGHRRLEKARLRRSEEKERRPDKEDNEDKAAREERLIDGDKARTGYLF